MRLLWAAACLCLWSAGRAAARPKSDLGEQGNLFVEKAFNDYRTLHPAGACRAQGSGRRAILTGYGLFEGVPYNISGTVVRSMADPDFWPARIELGTAAVPAAPAPRRASSVHGAVADNRTLFIDGQRYEVCFLVEDVIWDLAGAILVFEESRFKPELVLMTGRGGREASFEAGALNRASAYPGFDSEGHSLGTVNTPRSQWLVPDYPADYVMPMRWNSRELARRNEPDIKSVGCSVVGQTAARPENDYLCNDIAFVALHASQNNPTRLAGDRILLNSPDLPRTPVVGFMHFPAVDVPNPDPAAYGKEIFVWAKVLARTIRLTLP